MVQAVECCGVGDRLLTVEEALEGLTAAVGAVAAVESVPLVQAAGRVLAADQVSPIMVPPADYSAVDGWAVRAADLLPAGQTRLPVAGRIAAGRPLEGSASPGAAYRIFTGALLPAGADTVLMQEDCRTDGEHVLLPAAALGANVRYAGENIKVGDVPLVAGVRLRAQEIGVAAMMGLRHLPVRRRPRVAIFSTGDELREPGQPLARGAIYDANRYSLAALLENAGCVVSDLGILPDSQAAIAEALAAAAAGHHLLVTTGGVSVGEEDHVKAAVSSLGSLDFWRVAMKPGKPIAFGSVKGVPFLGLPGNPVAVMVTFLLFGRALVGRLSGETRRPLPRFMVPADFAITKRPGRREYPRGRLVDGPAGRRVVLFPSDSSGVLVSMTAAEGLVELSEAGCQVAVGDLVPFLPFTEMLW
ncbi:MAG TPA: molybdopterin molybdotransferase MoeA [Rhodospirillaceae bacterium]|nr:molybdopterin molybdotransferase MoeA [Rhodospirillaceae bacterium]